MLYLDANILYPMFAATEKRRTQFNNEGSSGNKLLDYCITLIRDIDSGDKLVVLSDLAIMETLGVASRDIGPKKARSILQAVNKQQFMEVIQTTQYAWMVAQSLTVSTSIEGRDSLHLANALLTQIVRKVITCDKDFAEKAQIFLNRNYQHFELLDELKTWYQISNEEQTDLVQIIKNRASELQFDLIHKQ